MRTPNHDVAIVGGGLCGLLAARRCMKLGCDWILIDRPLPDAGGLTGGFSRFSGAKFSLPPAGLGLEAVAGSERNLHQAIGETLDELLLSEMARALSLDRPLEPEPGDGLRLRQYASLVLLPEEIDKLLLRLHSRIDQGRIQIGEARSIRSDSAGCELEIALPQGTIMSIRASKVIVASGRTGSDLLSRAGAVPREGRGLDLGVRIEFHSTDAVSALRRLGPDAKILHGRCRTFCLNSPGKVYRYDYGKLRIAGGVVADKSCPKANVGILYRTQEKLRYLEQIKARAQVLSADLINVSRDTLSHEFLLPREVGELFGDDAAREISLFGARLIENGLIDTSRGYTIHSPLLDWHWPVFAAASDFSTTVRSVYVAGDAAGHARGLLQAAVSGWLVVEKVLSGSGTIR